MDESGVQSKGATSPSGNTKVMGKPPVPAGGGPQQVTSPNPIVQRLPAFLDNHNYAKSPMQVREASATKDDKFKLPVCPKTPARVTWSPTMKGSNLLLLRGSFSPSYLNISALAVFINLFAISLCRLHIMHYSDFFIKFAWLHKEKKKKKNQPTEVY